MNDLDDPEAGKDDDKADYSIGDDLFALLGVFGIAAGSDQSKAAEDHIDEKDDAGEDVDVGKDGGDEAKWAINGGDA